MTRAAMHRPQDGCPARRHRPGNPTAGATTRQSDTRCRDLREVRRAAAGRQLRPVPCADRAGVEPAYDQRSAERRGPSGRKVARQRRVAKTRARSRWLVLFDQEREWFAGQDGGECYADRVGGDARDFGLAVEPAEAVLDLLGVERVEAALTDRGHEQGARWLGRRHRLEPLLVAERLSARPRALESDRIGGAMLAAGWTCGGSGDLRGGRAGFGLAQLAGVMATVALANRVL